MGEQGRNQIEGYGILGQDEAVLRIRAAPRQKDKKRRPDMVNVCRVNSEKSRRESALWRGSAYASPIQYRLFLHDAHFASGR